MNRLTLSELDAGTPKVVEHDDDVLLTLPETPSTGYRWTVQASHPDVASVEEGRRGATTARPGKTGTREFPIRGKRKGSVILTAKLWRSWEGEGSAIRQLNFPIEFQ
jgi:inhibitor of cysteine peptidase